MSAEATSATNANQGGIASVGPVDGMIGSTTCATGLLTAENARKIVMTLSQAKLPVSTSHSWVRSTMAAATDATGCGAKRKNGTISWAKWLPSTSPR